jgi:phytoene dehydrogenase-like protein
MWNVSSLLYVSRPCRIVCFREALRIPLQETQVTTPELPTHGLAFPPSDHASGDPIARALRTALRTRDPADTAALRAIVDEFARRARAEGMLPEAALIAVKSSVRSAGSIRGADAPHMQWLMEHVVRWTVDGYYRAD